MLLAVNVLSAALVAGALVWAFLWSLTWLLSRLRWRGVFPDLVQRVAGTEARRQLRETERELFLLAAGAASALAAAAALLLYGGIRLSGVWMWLGLIPGVLLFLAWWIFLLRHVRRWRLRRFAARGQAAVGAALARLALQGHRIFHEVAVESGSVDHVVLGPRGLFALRVVARQPLRGAPNVVRINGRSIEFQDGFALLDTLALAERGARALADLKVPGLSHRPHVLPVVALPGWEIAPSQGQAGETFLVNEKTAVLLLKASKPADYLMDADIGLLQEHLARLSLDSQL